MKKAWPKDCPWTTEEEALAAFEAAWDDLMQRGIKAGILVQQEDGTLKGKGCPSKLFALDDE